MPEYSNPSSDQVVSSFNKGAGDSNLADGLTAIFGSVTFIVAVVIIVLLLIGVLGAKQSDNEELSNFLLSCLKGVALLFMIIIFFGVMTL